MFAMSLITLIYYKIKGIHICDDLVQILEMGNQLYSVTMYRASVFNAN